MSGSVLRRKFRSQSKPQAPAHLAAINFAHFEPQDDAVIEAK